MAGRVSRRVLARTVVNLLTEQHQKPAHVAKSLAAYLVTHKMAHQLDKVLKDVTYELVQRDQQVYAEVRSAHELSQTLQQEIAHFLREAYGVRHVELHAAIDSELVGGVVVTTPDAELDTSIRTKLRALGQA